MTAGRRLDDPVVRQAAWRLWTFGLRRWRRDGLPFAVLGLVAYLAARGMAARAGRKP